MGKKNEINGGGEEHTHTTHAQGDPRAPATDRERGGRQGYGDGGAPPETPYWNPHTAHNLLSVTFL